MIFPSLPAEGVVRGAVAWSVRAVRVFQIIAIKLLKPIRTSTVVVGGCRGVGDGATFYANGPSSASLGSCARLFAI